MSLSNGTSSSYEEPRGYYCTICYHGYKKDGSGVPRNLTCGHTFCTECLKRLAGQATSFGHVRCPACKVDTVINSRGSFPSNDVRKLPKNFGLLEILEGVEDSVQGRGAALADAIMENPQLVCEEHEKEAKKVYCLTDKEMICIYCQVYGKHQGHNCQLIGKVAEEGRQVLGTYIEMLSKQRDHMNEARKQILDTTFVIRFREENIMRDLTRHFEMLRKKLYKRENQLKTQIKNKCNVKIEVLDKQQRTMSEIIVKCERLRALCQMSQSSDDHDVVSGKDEMEGKISKILEDVSRCNLEPEAQDDVFCQLDSTLAESILQYGMVGEDKGRAEMAHPAVGGSSDSTEMTSGSTTTTPETSSTEESADDHTLTVPASHKSSTRSGVRDSSDHNIFAFDLDETDRNHQAGVSRTNPDAEPPEVSIVFENGLKLPARSDIPYADADAGGADSAQASQTNGSQQPVKRAAALSDQAADMDSEASSMCMVLVDVNAAGESSQAETSSADKGAGTSSADRGAETKTRHSATDGKRSFQDMLRFGSATLLCSSSSSDDSSDLSCLSDLEVEMELPQRPQESHSAPDVIDGEADLERDEHGATGSVSVRRRKATNAVPVSTPSNLPDPWEVNPQAHSPSSQSGSPSSRCSSLEGDNVTCSVLSCSNSAKAWLKCRNCSRAFCFGCAKTTVSARRCYKRPRGHSFVRISEGAAGKDVDDAQGPSPKPVSGCHGYSLRPRLQVAPPMMPRCENAAEKTWKCLRCGYFNMITANRKNDFCCKCRSQRTL